MPVLITKNAVHLASCIGETTREASELIVENAPCVQVLSPGFVIDDVIPSEHYKVVAEIIDRVFRLKIETGR